MLKPLISAIPSKKVNICGFEYETYGVVSVPWACTNRIPSVKTSISVCLGGVLQRASINPYRPQSLERVRRRTQLMVEDGLAKLHAYVEKEYQGDRLRFAIADDKCVVSTCVRENKTYTICIYQVKKVETMKGRKVTRCIGRTEQVTPEDIQRAVQEAKKHRIAAAHAYNEALIAQRKAFRELVDQQIKERDYILGY